MAAAICNDLIFLTPPALAHGFAAVCIGLGGDGFKDGGNEKIHRDREMGK